jgi:hypothetical protein
VSTPNRSQRRTFVRRFGAIAAGMGAMLSGVVPELKAQTLSTTPPVADLSLSIEDQNALYAAALNDADVAAIVGALGQPLRIDPPRSSYLTNAAPGQSMISVLIPLTSYATGVPAAYLYFGVASLTDQNGVPQTLPVRLAIANDGFMRVALAGVVQVVPSPATAPDTARMLFAAFFPEEYLTSVDKQVSSAGAENRVAEARPSGFFRKTMYAGGGDPAALKACRDATRDCLTGPYYACLAGSAGLVLCAVCTAACFFPNPLMGMTCWGAVQLCTGAAGAFAACLVVINSCMLDYQDCKKKAMLPAPGGARA